MARHLHKWEDVFGSKWKYGWHCNRDASHALEIPGHKVRSYLARSNAYIKTRFIVNVYVGKQYIMQELVYRPVTKGSLDFLPFPPRAYRNLFSDMKKNMMGWRFSPNWIPLMEIEEISGRIMFKVKTSNWNRLICGVNLHNISETPWGLLIEKFGFALPFAGMYSDTIKTLDDAAEVWSAVNDLARLNYKRNGYFEEEIARHRSLMADKMKAIEGYQSNLDGVCDGAANAMDVLESQYGLKVMV